MVVVEEIIFLLDQDVAREIVLRQLQIVPPKKNNIDQVFLGQCLNIYMRALGLICLFIVLFSCEKMENNNVPVFNYSELNIHELSFDTLILEKYYFSGVGFLSVGEDKIFFVDQIFSVISEYSSSGNYIGTFLGKGEGPDEQNNIHGFQPFSYQGNHVVLDNFEYVLFDKNFQKIQSFPIEWNYFNSENDMLNNPDGNMLGLYEVDWKSKGLNTSFLMHSDTNQTLLPISMSHPDLNGYISEEYYKEVFLFGLYDFQLKKVMSGFGARSDEYLNHLFVPNFDFSFFTKSEENIFVSFAIDPLIHVFDWSGNLLYKFGFEGLDMKKSFPITKTIEEALDNHKTDLEKAGFYHHIYYDPEIKLTFRSYFPEGAGQGFSRLQIFKENTLVGDIEVPERFKVIGKIGGYYYADGLVDEVNDELGIFKFKMPN